MPDGRAVWVVGVRAVGSRCGGCALLAFLERVVVGCPLDTGGVLPVADSLAVFGLLSLDGEREALPPDLRRLERVGVFDLVVPDCPAVVDVVHGLVARWSGRRRVFTNS